MNFAATPIVEVRELRKAYRVGRMGLRLAPALRGVSLQVLPGEIVGLIGPNRAGKTTLVKCILGLCRPDSGTILRWGRPVSDRDVLRRIGYVHESLAFPRYLTAREVLDFYGAATRLLSNDRRRRIQRLLEQFELADRQNEAIGCFSKGMLQRLALAQALLAEPELLILDEPAEGMDLLARQMMRRTLEDQRARGGTVLLVSHSLPEVARLCDRVALLREGALVRCGSLTEVAGDQDALSNVEDALTPLFAGTCP